jgi:hypothetical protein
MWHLGVHHLDGLMYFLKIKCLKQDNQHVNLTTLSRSHVNATRVSFSNFSLCTHRVYTETQPNIFFVKNLFLS